MLNKYKVLLIILLLKCLSCKNKRIRKVHLDLKDSFEPIIMTEFEKFTNDEITDLSFSHLINKFEDAANENADIPEKVKKLQETFKLLIILLALYQKLNENLPYCIDKIDFDIILSNNELADLKKIYDKEKNSIEYQHSKEELREKLIKNKNIKDQEIRDNSSKLMEIAIKTRLDLKYIYGESKIPNDYFKICLEFISKNIEFMMKFWSNKIKKIVNKGTSIFSYIRNLFPPNVQINHNKEINIYDRLSSSSTNFEGMNIKFKDCIVNVNKKKFRKSKLGKMRLMKGDILDYVKKVLAVIFSPVILAVALIWLIILGGCALVNMLVN